LLKFLGIVRNVKKVAFSYILSCFIKKMADYILG